MSKVLKIVGAVASVAAMIPGPHQPFAAAIAVAANVGAALTAKTPSVGGTQTSFKSDPRAPIPICVGRTLTGGNIVYWKSHGKKNKYLSLVSILSLGPAQSIDATYIDKVQASFSGKAATGNLSGLLWQDTQLGLCPESGVLTPGEGSPPEWTSNSKLSGLSAIMWTLKYDGKGDITLVQVPRGGWLGHWVKGYDPRKDSTYPGGSGSHRWNDETTWEWTENPYVIGLTFAIGWHQNGIRVGGVGLNVDSIDVDAFVEGANVCDANGWKIGGSFTTADDKWDVLKAVLQAGGGEPIRLGAMLSCIVNTPRVPIATITEDDIIGPCSIPMMKTRRDRFNGVIPTYRSEDHDWEVVPAGAVYYDDLVTADGDERTREIAYSMVQCTAGQTPDQATQLAGYDIANSREADGIVIPLKLKWIGYRAGDCLECTAPMTGLAGKQLIVRNRAPELQSGGVTLTLRTEDPDKHERALALTGVAAPTTSLNAPPVDVAPDGGNWTLDGVTIVGASGSIPALVLEGSTSDDTTADLVRIEVRVYDSMAGDNDNWSLVSTERADFTKKIISDGIAPGTQYEVSLRYISAIGMNMRVSPRLILGPETAGDLDIPAAPLGPATDLQVSPGSGVADIDWRNPAGADFGYCNVYRGTTTVFGDATEIAGPIVGGLGEVMTYPDTVSAGTWYYWVRAFSTGADPTTPTGPVEAIVT